jgi:lysozyme
VNAELLQTLRDDEGWSATPYRCPAGRLTVGYGHNIDANGLPDYATAELKATGCLSRETGERLLLEDLGIAAEAARRWLGPTWGNLTPNRQNVVACMSFQLGEKTMRSFGQTRRFLLSGQWRNAAHGMLRSRWARQTPERVRRLAALMEAG